MFIHNPSLVTHPTIERMTNPRSGIPPSRMDVQRRYLEHKTMMNLDSLHNDHRQQDLYRALAHRQQLELARGARTSVASRLRNSLATVLLTAGHRIRTEDTATTFNC